MQKARRRGGSSWTEAGGATRSSVGVTADVVAARRGGVRGFEGEGAQRLGRDEVEGADASALASKGEGEGGGAGNGAESGGGHGSYRGAG